MAQITDETDVASCSTCSEPDNDAGTNLKLCAKCRITKYCSRECQKTDWKVHKKICSRNAAARAENITASPTAASTSTSGPNASSGNAATTTKSLEKTIDRPFHKLETGTWLHNRSETDVYKLLIDTYRLRMEDNYKLEGEACADSIYGEATDTRPAFRGFLRLVESRRRLLPS